MKHFFGKKSRSALALVLMISLGIHVVAVVIFGTIKFVSEVLREEPELVAVAVEQVKNEPPPKPVNVQQRMKTTPPPTPPAIAVNRPADLDVPELDISVNIETSSVIGRSAGGFSGGGLDAVRDAANVANLFGKSVSASQLGVILDVSFSTHGVLSSVVEEIQNSFPDALIVFVPGCGIDDRDGELVPVSEYEETSKRYKHMHNGSRAFATKPFIDALLKRDDFLEIWKRAESNKNGFVIFADLKTHNGIAGSNTAMKYLADNGADVIYWFADFDDRIDEDIAKKTAKYLGKNDVKVMLHDFVGELGKNHNKEHLEYIAQRTDGEFFLKTF